MPRLCRRGPGLAVLSPTTISRLGLGPVGARRFLGRSALVWTRTTPLDFCCSTRRADTPSNGRPLPEVPHRSAARRTQRVAGCPTTRSVAAKASRPRRQQARDPPELAPRGTEVPWVPWAEEHRVEKRANAFSPTRCASSAPCRRAGQRAVLKHSAATSARPRPPSYRRPAKSDGIPMVGTLSTAKNDAPAGPRRISVRRRSGPDRAPLGCANASLAFGSAETAGP
jgi:hypothetical protein